MLEGSQSELEVGPRSRKVRVSRSEVYTFIPPKSVHFYTAVDNSVEDTGGDLDEKHSIRGHITLNN